MKRKVVFLAVAALALLGACAENSASRSSSSTQVRSTKPTRIVSMSATATEMLFAIGAGRQVAAVDDQSNFPAKAPKTALSAYEPNVEAIAGYRPDLVVLAGDAKNLTGQLDKLAIPVLLAPPAKTLDDSYRQLADLGARTGHGTEATEVVATMKRRVAELTKTAQHAAGPVTYYHELDNTLFSVTSKTFMGELYALAGLQNIADAADVGGASGGYPQITAEYLVKADPDAVFLADSKCCAQTPATFAARPGLADLKAVKANHVFTLDDDIASRWGPRVVDLLAQIIEAARTVRRS
jgi:iron complex transport system substrate-binding protein